MQKIYYFLGNLFLKFCILFARVPGFWRLWAWLFGFFLLIFSYRKKIIQKNLDIVFKNSLSRPQKEKIRRRMYFFFGYESGFFLRLSCSNPQKIKPLIEVEGNESCLKICKQKQAFILLSAHTFGIWISAIFATFFREIATYTYHGPDKASNQIYKLFQEVEKRFPLTVISQGKNDTFKMLRFLKAGHCLSIIGDLNAFQSNVFVPFFGKMASFGEGAFRLSLRKNIPLIFSWIEETKEKKLILHLREIYNPQNKEHSQKEKGLIKNPPSTEELIKRYSNLLEKVILQKPHWYFWSNRRWKTRPPGDNEKVYS